MAQWYLSNNCDPRTEGAGQYGKMDQHRRGISMRKWWIYLVIATMLSSAAPMQAADSHVPPEWTTPIAPFRIADNLYYVGSLDLASYLVVTPKGDILINSSLESSPALIQKSVEQLGFKFKDIKILLISHAHSDHDAGSAEVKRLTGAKY